MNNNGLKKKLKVLLFINENSQFSKYHFFKLLVQTDVELIGIISNRKTSSKTERTKFFSIHNFLKRLIDRMSFESNVLLLRLQKALVKSHNIRIMSPKKLNQELASQISLMEPDLIISAGYVKKIPTTILNIPRIGSFNFHPSLLPAYAGGNPWFWVIAKGEKYTGVTIHVMNSVYDAGDIVIQKRIRIVDGATEQNLIYATTVASINLIPNFIQLCKENKLVMRSQTLSKRSYFRKVTDLDRKINWNDNAENIKNLIQACLSGFGAWSKIKDERLWINKAYIGNNIDRKYKKGMIINISGDGIEVATNDKTIFITAGIINSTRINNLDIVKKLKLRKGDIFN